MSEIDIEWTKLSELKTEPKNPKKHDIEKIMLSIERFGFINPFIKNYDTGKLLAGHGRKQALELMKKKGLTKPEQLKEEDGDWLVPVVSGVNIESEKDALAYLVADNRLVELGGWNAPELLEAIEQITDSTPDLEDIGLADEEVEALYVDDGPLDTAQENTEPKEFNIYFDMFFENDYQQEMFYRFLEHLKTKYPGDTIAERLDNHILDMIKDG
jgi:hypothetical protein